MKQPIVRLGFSLTLGLALTFAALWLLGGRLPVAGAAGAWFVNPTGNDGNSCASAGDACLTIGGAVGKAASGDTIHIAAGTYVENVNLSGKALTLSGAGAATTSVDGGGAGRVLDADSDVTLADLTLQNGSEAASDGGALRATAAVTLTNVNVLSSTAFYNGGGVYATGPLVITGGRFQANGGNQGGGVYAAGTLTVSGTQFVSNTAVTWGGGARAVLAASVSGGLFQGNSGSSGGGLFAEAALTVAGTQFISNTVVDFGGGAYSGGAAGLSDAVFAGNMAGTGGGAQLNGAATVTGTTFFSNTAATGGGAHFNAVAALTNTVFTQNLGSSTTVGGGGAAFIYAVSLHGGAFVSNTSNFAGGGAYFNAAADIANTAFTSNTATLNRGGGGYFNGPAVIAGAAFTANQTPIDRGGGAYFRDTAALTGTDFVGNLSPSLSAGRGAGAYFFAATVLTGTRFLSNTVGVHGGGAYFNTTVLMQDTRFISNTALVGNGGGAFQGGAGSSRIVNGLFSRNRSGAGGADLFLDTSGSTTVLHTTLANAALNADAAVYANRGSVAVTNTIFANAAGGLVISTSVTASADYNLYFNAPTNAITGSHSLTGTDPLFVNPAAGDFHLGGGSPAVGAGLNLGVAADLDGAPRGSLPSLGAYELPVYPLTIVIAGTGLGSVSVVPSQTVYAQGTVLSLTAVAGTDSTFTGWSGAAAGLANPLSLTVTSATSLTATFDLNADLALSLEADQAQAAAGTLVTYTLVVTNTGPALATTARLTDTLPLSGTFQALASPGGWGCLTPGVDTTGQVVCTAASLPVGTPYTFTITVRLNDTLLAAEFVTSTATVTAAEPDPNAPNTAVATIQVYAYRYYFPIFFR